MMYGVLLANGIITTSWCRCKNFHDKIWVEEVEKLLKQTSVGTKHRLRNGNVKRDMVWRWIDDQVPLQAHGDIKRSSSSTSVNLDMLPALLLAIGDDSRQIRHVSSRCPVCRASDMFSKLRVRGVGSTGQQCGCLRETPWTKSSSLTLLRDKGTTSLETNAPSVELSLPLCMKRRFADLFRTPVLWLINMEVTHRQLGAKYTHAICREGHAFTVQAKDLKTLLYETVDICKLCASRNKIRKQHDSSRDLG